MKRLIYLKVAYGEKSDKALEQFRSDLKTIGYIKLVNDYSPKPQVLVEFPNDKQWDAYEALRQLDIVSIIDSILPKDEE